MCNKRIASINVQECGSSLTVRSETQKSSAVTLVPWAPPCGRVRPRPPEPGRARVWFSRSSCTNQPSNGGKRCQMQRREGQHAETEKERRRFPYICPLSPPVVALTSLVTQLITLVLRRFIALHSNCTNAPDFQTAFMAALLRRRGGCLVIRGRNSCAQ